MFKGSGPGRYLFREFIVQIKGGDKSNKVLPPKIVHGRCLKPEFEELSRDSFIKVVHSTSQRVHRKFLLKHDDRQRIKQESTRLRVKSRIVFHKTPLVHHIDLLGRKSRWVRTQDRGRNGDGRRPGTRSINLEDSDLKKIWILLLCLEDPTGF